MSLSGKNPDGKPYQAISGDPHPGRGLAPDDQFVVKASGGKKPALNLKASGGSRKSSK
jgi:hypothetical protein